MTYPASWTPGVSPGAGALADYFVGATELAGSQPHDDVYMNPAVTWCCDVEWFITPVGAATRVFCKSIKVDYDALDPFETCFNARRQGDDCYTARSGRDCFDVPRDPRRCA